MKYDLLTLLVEAIIKSLHSSLKHFVLTVMTLVLNDRQVLCVCLLVKCLLAGDPVVSRWCL